VILLYFVPLKERVCMSCRLESTWGCFEEWRWVGFKVVSFLLISKLSKPISKGNKFKHTYKKSHYFRCVRRILPKLNLNLVLNKLENTRLLGHEQSFAESRQLPLWGQLTALLHGILLAVSAVQNFECVTVIGPSWRQERNWAIQATYRPVGTASRL
jgi:hypothetical protein